MHTWLLSHHQQASELDPGESIQLRELLVHSNELLLLLLSGPLTLETYA